MGQEDIRTNRQRKRQRQKEAELAVLAANTKTLAATVVKGFRWESAEKRLQRKALKKAQQQEVVKSKNNPRKEKKRAKRKTAAAANIANGTAVNSGSPAAPRNSEIGNSAIPKAAPVVDENGAIENGGPVHTTVISKYQCSEFPGATLLFKDRGSWKNGSELRELFDNGVQRLEFGEEFKITDAHLNVLTWAGISTLSHLSIADSSMLNDGPILCFAIACPNLTHIELRCPTNLTDTCLYGLLAHCPKLQYIGFTGTGEHSYLLTSSSINPLIHNDEIAKNLKKLELTDQMNPDITANARHVSEARKSLELIIGSTRKTRGFLEIWHGGEQELNFPKNNGGEEKEARSKTPEIQTTTTMAPTFLTTDFTTISHSKVPNAEKRGICTIM